MPFVPRSWVDGIILDAADLIDLETRVTDYADTLPGPTGATGATGAKGATGATGTAGPTGATGTAGIAGATGATGPPGTAGATGPAGTAGVAGATGATGPQGTAGVAGVTGATGPTGGAGTAGAVGATGDTGPTGPAGTAGAVGATGATGPTGPQGTAGAAGTAGATGATGTAGPAGATGATGGLDLPRARILRSTAQTIPGSTPTAISFDSHPVDSNAFWAAGAPTRVVIGTTGWYEIDARANFANAVDVPIRLYLTKNGVTGTHYGEDRPRFTGNSVGNEGTLQTSVKMELVAGDYLELIVYQASGLPLDTSMLGGTAPGSAGLEITMAGATGTGFVGATGATGPQGTAGTAGAVGATGATGAQGTAGATGATGTAGATGATGATPSVVDFRARCTVAQGAAGAGVHQKLLFNSDAVAYNNGGFTYQSAGSGTLQNGVIVPTTGEYHIAARCGTLANSQYLTMDMLVNGSSTLPDGSKVSSGPGSPASLQNAHIGIDTTLHLTAGDLIQFDWYQGGGPQNLFADYTTWAVEKVSSGPVGATGATGPTGPAGTTATMDTWHSVGAAGEPAFQNGWGNGGSSYQTVQFRLDPFGRVLLRGYISGGTNGATAFVLPAGYRPPAKLIMGALNAASPSCYIEVGTGGVVTVISTGAAGFHIDCIFDTDSVTTYAAGPTGPTGAAGTGQLLTPTAKSAAYTAVSNDYVICINGGYTITLPSPTAGRIVGVRAASGQTGASPVTVSTPSGAILGLGIAAAATSMLLGIPGAFVTLLADGTNWHVVDGGQDTGWIAVNIFGGAWTNFSTAYEPAEYRKTPDGVVRLHGLILRSGPYAGNEAVLNIPAGFRAAKQSVWAQTANNGVLWCEVRTNGDILVVQFSAGADGGSNRFLSLSGISYLAA